MHNSLPPQGLAAPSIWGMQLLLGVSDPALGKLALWALPRGQGEVSTASVATADLPLPSLPPTHNLNRPQVPPLPAPTWAKFGFHKLPWAVSEDLVSRL